MNQTSTHFISEFWISSQNVWLSSNVNFPSRLISIFLHRLPPTHCRARMLSERSVQCVTTICNPIMQRTIDNASLTTSHCRHACSPRLLEPLKNSQWYAFSMMQICITVMNIVRWKSFSNVVATLTLYQYVTKYYLNIEKKYVLHVYLDTRQVKHTFTHTQLDTSLQYYCLRHCVCMNP